VSRGGHRVAQFRHAIRLAGDPDALFDPEQSEKTAQLRLARPRLVWIDVCHGPIEVNV
jgi:hypothetical protein